MISSNLPNFEPAVTSRVKPPVVLVVPPMARYVTLKPI